MFKCWLISLNCNFRIQFSSSFSFNPSKTWFLRIWIRGVVSLASSQSHLRWPKRLLISILFFGILQMHSDIEIHVFIFVFWKSCHFDKGSLRCAIERWGTRLSLLQLKPSDLLKFYIWVLVLRHVKVRRLLVAVKDVLAIGLQESLHILLVCTWFGFIDMIVLLWVHHNLAFGLLVNIHDGLIDFSAAEWGLSLEFRPTFLY